MRGKSSQQPTLSPELTSSRLCDALSLTSLSSPDLSQIMIKLLFDPEIYYIQLSHYSVHATEYNTSFFAKFVHITLKSDRLSLHYDPKK